MREFLKRVAIDRARGQRPATPRAAGAAAMVGTAAAVVTFRVLRHERRK
jgi:hypothetical protein